MISIDLQKCSLCGKCLRVCGSDGITLDRDAKSIEINDNCTNCNLCVDHCPFDAMAVSDITYNRDFPEYSGVLVCAELESRDDTWRVSEVTFELLTKARELAHSLGEKLKLLVVGDFLHDYTLFDLYEIDTIHLADNDALVNYSVEAYTAAAVELLRQLKPSIVLLPGTSRGRALAPRIAGRLKTGLTADCTELTIGNEGRLHQIRPAFGGNIMATIETPNHRPQIATVRPNTFKNSPVKESVKPTIVKSLVKLHESDFLTRIVETIYEEQRDFNLQEADVVVSVGKGIGSRGNILLAKRLAEKLGATLAGSRAVVELGWVDHCRQVGQSGKTVSPKLYIALGISGAVQHLVGMSGSGKIIAVNSDPDAPIFSVADYGIVGDCVTVCEALLQRT